MLKWICDNIGLIIICTILIVLVTLAIISVIKDKKKGRSSCGCNCGSCPMSGSCHSKK